MGDPIKRFFRGLRALPYMLNPFLITDWPHEGLGKLFGLTELNPEVSKIPTHVNIEGYNAYIDSCGIDYPAYDQNWHEKSLEHYMSIQLMGGIQQDDIVMDIASQGSPFPDIVRKTAGCTVFRQDLCYPEGVHGQEIGGDATQLPLSDNTVTKITLHCSFEHFEQDGDSRFILEAGRVLKPGGKLCILPLYMMKRSTIVTDPMHPGWNRKRFNEARKFDPEARVIYKIGYGDADFVRFYDLNSLSNRLLMKARD